MRFTRRMIPVAALVTLALTSSLLLAEPSVVQGAPLLQETPPPRPTVGPTLPPSSDAAAQSNVPISSAITLALVVDKAVAQPGDTLHYEAQVTNAEGQEATNVWLTCDLPEEVEVQEASTTMGTVHHYGQRISIELGRLSPAFESQHVTILTRIRDEVEAGTELIGHANLTSDQAGGGEHSVTTVVEDKKPKTIRDVFPLPTTGRGTIPLWMGLGFLVLIVVVALLSTREQTLPR